MPILEFLDVTKVFLPIKDGVFDIKFTVDYGEFVFLTGPSGAGKTTLLRLLNCEYIPDKGVIKCDQSELTGIKGKILESHRRQIGVAYQDYQLVSELNVWENVALPLVIAGKKTTEVEHRVTELLDLVDLHQKALLFPKQLSGGEAQRVSIARALALEPKIIFADEPTGNLDANTSLGIAKLIKQINQTGVAVIIATHDSNILNLYPDARIIELQKGKIVRDTKSTESINTKPHSIKLEEPRDQNLPESHQHKLKLNKDKKRKTKLS